MEGEDKSLLPVEGKPLIQYITDQMAGYFDEIIIGSNFQAKYAFLGYPVIPDIEEGKGPLMGIVSCLKASKNELNFVTACDIPDINMSLIFKMISLAENNEIVMPVADTDKYEPLFALYKKSVINYGELLLKNNKRSVLDLFTYVKPYFIDFKNEDWYRNLNYKKDYLDFIQKRYKSQNKG
jgi:molybdopterin-guanine dinucleotide biosynthesis protein A